MGTIKSSREIDAMFTAATRASHPLLVILARSTPANRDSSGRTAFVAGKRIGGAVARNRAKRVLREAARRADAPWPGFDVVFLARPGVGSASPAELDRAVVSTLKRAGVLL